jgi:hypothetical protein
VENDAPIACGPHKTMYNRFECRREIRARQTAFYALAVVGGLTSSSFIALPLAKTGDSLPGDRRDPGGRNTKIHAVCDGHGRLLTFLLTGGNAADAPQALAFLEAVPESAIVIADKVYDANVIESVCILATFPLDNNFPCPWIRSSRRGPGWWSKAAARP